MNRKAAFIKAIQHVGGIHTIERLLKEMHHTVHETVKDNQCFQSIITAGKTPGNVMATGKRYLIGMDIQGESWIANAE